MSHPATPIYHNYCEKLMGYHQASGERRDAEDTLILTFFIPFKKNRLSQDETYILADNSSQHFFSREEALDYADLQFNKETV